MADKKIESEKKDAEKIEKPVEQVLTVEELQASKTKVLDGLWGAGTSKVLDDPKSKTEKSDANEKKKDDKPNAEGGNGGPAGDDNGSGKGTGGGKAGDVQAGATNAEPVESGQPKSVKKIVVKKKGGKEKEEPAAEVVQPNVEETVRRVLDEQRGHDSGAYQNPDSRAGSHAVSEETALAPQDREVISVLTKMGEDNPRHKGLANQVTEFWKKEESFQTQWEQAHQGEDFDPDAPEHKSWYSRNEPKYPADEFEETKSKIAEERIVARAREEARKEYEPRLREIDARERAKEVEPAAEQRANEAVVDLLASVPEFQAAMDDGKGNLVLSEAVEAKLVEANPALFDIANEEANRLSVTVRALEKHVAMPEHFPADMGHSVTVDGKRVRPFAEITDTFNELQNAVASAPREKRMLGGRDFLTTQDKRARQDQIIKGQGTREQKQAALSRLEETTWTIQPEDVRDRLIKQSQARVKSFAEKSKKWLGSTKNGEHKNGEPAKPTEVDKKPDKATLPPSGATASVSDNRDNAKKDTDGSDKFAEKVVTAMW